MNWPLQGKRLKDDPSSGWQQVTLKGLPAERKGSQEMGTGLVVRFPVPASPSPITLTAHWQPLLSNLCREQCGLMVPIY